MDLVNKIQQQINEDLRDKVSWAYEIVYAQQIAESEQQYLKKIANALQERDLPNDQSYPQDFQTTDDMDTAVDDVLNYVNEF